MSPTHWPKALLTPAPRPALDPALTQQVKMGLNATGTGHRANQPGLEKSAPFVHQHPLAASVILGVGGPGSALGPGGQVGPSSGAPTPTRWWRGTDTGLAPSPPLPCCCGWGRVRERSTTRTEAPHCPFPALTTQTRPTRLTVTWPGPPSGEGTVSEKKKYTLSSFWSELSAIRAAITNRGSAWGEVIG